MEAAGIECGTLSPEDILYKQVTSGSIHSSATCQHGHGTNLLDLTQIDASLRRVINAWAGLPAAVREEVEAMCLPPASCDQGNSKWLIDRAKK